MNLIPRESRKSKEYRKSRRPRKFRESRQDFVLT